MTDAVKRLGIPELIGDKREQVIALVVSQGASNVRIFGSVARGEAGADSDIDILVDGLENTVWGGGSLMVQLAKLLGRPVDLLSPDDLHWYIRDKVLKEAVPL